jgi:hypothetical protein
MRNAHEILFSGSSDLQNPDFARALNISHCSVKRMETSGQISNNVTEREEHGPQCHRFMKFCEQSEDFKSHFTARESEIDCEGERTANCSFPVFKAQLQWRLRIKWKGELIQGTLNEPGALCLAAISNRCVFKSNIEKARSQGSISNADFLL